MAKERMSCILAETANLAAGTEVIDILEQDPISRLDIKVKLNGSGTPGANYHPALAITKIELVDGSDVLFSMNGKQARAMAILGTGKLPADEIVYLYNNNCYCIIHIPFGRHLFDDSLALIPTAFKNLQLKITHDRALGGNKADALTLQIFAQTFDEKKITPPNFLMTKKVYDFIGSSGGWEYIDLPTDLIYRQIVIQGEVSGYSPNTVYNKIKLSEDNDKKVPINEIPVADYLKFTLDRFNPITETQRTGGDTDSMDHPCMCNYVNTINMLSDTIGTPTYSAVDTAAGGTFRFRSNAILNQWIEITGYVPHGAMGLVICGDPQDPTDWYEVAHIGSLQLQIYGGTQSGNTTTAILIQQVRPNSSARYH